MQPVVYHNYSPLVVISVIDGRRLIGLWAVAAWTGEMAAAGENYAPSAEK